MVQLPKKPRKCCTKIKPDSLNCANFAMFTLVEVPLQRRYLHLGHGTIGGWRGCCRRRHGQLLGDVGCGDQDDGHADDVAGDGVEVDHLHVVVVAVPVRLAGSGAQLQRSTRVLLKITGRMSALHCIVDFSKP